MDFRLLGPLEVLDDDGREVLLRPGRQRALLALLVLRANELVASELLVEELWGESPPPTALKMLRNQVSALRRALGANERLETQGSGYRLKIADGERDVDRFEAMVARGRARLGGDPQRAAAAFREALGLWRGPVLADLGYEAFVQSEAGRLEERRLVAFEGRIEAELAVGGHADLISELEVAVAEQPLRERLHGQLMLALYRCGRQAEALEAYRRARETLVGQLGLEPGPELRALHQGLLTHDAALQAPAPTPESPVSRLPAPPTRTIGREKDCHSLVELLHQEEVRLVTLTGPGGVGKTRLALEVARQLESEFADGVWFVSLASTQRVEHVPGAVAQALVVTPLPGEVPQSAVERFLGPRQALVVLDNLEHLLAVVPLVSALLASAPGLTLLTTSREPLRVRPEHRYVVAPLSVPDEGDPAALEQTAATELFIERARSHDRGFEANVANAGAIADICRRLDGLPLAIELAAARTSVLSPEELNARLVHPFQVLGSGPRDAPVRQRTLRATIDWSHRLLNAQEAEAFARSAVFAGGATIEAAQAVTGAELETLAGLVDKQLLVRRHGSSPEARFLMLETVREYASERLDTHPDPAEIHDRHCRYYLRLAECAQPELRTRGEAVWLPRLDAEVDNLRAALDWSVRHGNPTLALQLAGLLADFWAIRRRFGEGLECIEAALDATGEDAPIQDRARARRGQALLLESQGAAYDVQARLEEARACAADALDLSREAGGAAGIAEALLNLGSLEVAESHPRRRRRAFAEEALIYARKAGDDRLVAFALMQRAGTLPPVDAVAEVEEAAAALRMVGSTRPLAHLYSNAVYDAVKTGAPERARPLLDRAVPLARELGEPLTLAFVCGHAGLEALFMNDLDRAVTAFEEQLRLCREHGLQYLAGEGLGGLAAIATRRGDWDRAARLLGAATAAGPVGDADLITQLEERFFAPARERHGKRRWNEAHTAGAEMTFERAIALALNTRPTPN